MGISQDKLPCFFSKYIVMKQRERQRDRGRDRSGGEGDRDRQGERRGVGAAEKGRERLGDRQKGMEEKPIYEKDYILNLHVN